MNVREYKTLTQQIALARVIKIYSNPPRKDAELVKFTYKFTTCGRLNKIRIFFPGFLCWECLRRRSQPLCEPAAGPSPLRRRPPIEEMVFFVGSMFAELQFSGVIS